MNNCGDHTIFLREISWTPPLCLRFCNTPIRFGVGGLVWNIVVGGGGGRFLFLPFPANRCNLENLQDGNLESWIACGTEQNEYRTPVLLQDSPRARMMLHISKNDTPNYRIPTCVANSFLGVYVYSLYHNLSNNTKFARLIILGTTTCTAHYTAHIFQTMPLKIAQHPFCTMHTLHATHSAIGVYIVHAFHTAQPMCFEHCTVHNVHMADCAVRKCICTLCTIAQGTKCYKVWQRALYALCTMQTAQHVLCFCTNQLL